MSSNPITIQGWQKGIANSPYLGFSKMVGLDIFRKPGIIQAGLRLDATTPITTALINCSCIDAQGNTYYGTNDGKFYKNTTLVNTSPENSPIHDMVIVYDANVSFYFIIISYQGTTLDIYKVSDGTFTSTWVSGLQDSHDANGVNGWKKMFLGQDNVVYIANVNKLASIVGFNSASPAINLSALSTGLPQGRTIQTICEMGKYVAISTSDGFGTSGNTKIYFMDRGTLNGTGTGFYLSLPIDIPERIINQMTTTDNRLYFFGCDTGTFYTSNSITYSAIAIIPMRLPTQNYTTYATSIAILNNEILWGIGGAYNSAYNTVYGVYALRGNSIICKNIISSGEYGQTTSVAIGSIFNISGNYQVGWQTGNSTFGLDTSSTNIGTSFGCWFESPFYETGTALLPRAFETIQFNFGQNLVDNQRLRVSYRSAINKAWSTPVIYSWKKYGAVNSLHDKFPTENTTNIQLKVEFDTNVITPDWFSTQSIVLATGSNTLTHTILKDTYYLQDICDLSANIDTITVYNTNDGTTTIYTAGSGVNNLLINENNNQNVIIHTTAGATISLKVLFDNTIGGAYNSTYGNNIELQSIILI